MGVNGSDLVKLVAAFLAGLALGAEREYHDKSAGMRTIILICVGSALFTIFSVRIAGDKDPGRVAAQIVSGIGFLGAGVILVRRGQVLGLTTASTIWVAAALGIGMGVGSILFTAIATALVIFVLGVLPPFERVFQRATSFKHYKITLALDPAKPDIAKEGVHERRPERARGEPNQGEGHDRAAVAGGGQTLRPPADVRPDDQGPRGEGVRATRARQRSP